MSAEEEVHEIMDSLGNVRQLHPSTPAELRRDDRGSVGVLVRVHPTGHHRGSRSGSSSIERRKCHRGDVRPGRLTR